MSKSEEWMPLYLGAYLADTSALTTLQHGAYFLLIMGYWKRGPLPMDERVLATIARVELPVWRDEIWPALQGFFKHDPKTNLLHQSRLDHERGLTSSKKRTPPTAEPKPVAPSPASVGTRLPENWEPTGGYAEFARSGGLNPKYVGVRFRDYWLAKTGADACKASWPATWRRWCRNTPGWQEPEKGAASPTAPVERKQTEAERQMAIDVVEFGL